MKVQAENPAAEERKRFRFMQEYTLKTNFAALEDAQANEYLMDFGKIIEKEFEYSDSRLCLLGNLLVLERYCNTVRQGLAGHGHEAQLSVRLRYAKGLLWDYLCGRITAADFANDYYAWLLEHCVGSSIDLYESLYAEYFADSCPESYEWFAVEWSSGLLMQLVSIEGGRVDHEDFDECGNLDFYGPLSMLEDVCIYLTDTPVASNRGADLEEAMAQVRKTSLFQEIVMHVQNDLQTALLAAPAEWEALRKEYGQYTILPERYAARMLEY